MEKQIAKLEKFYVEKKVVYKGRIGTVKSIKMMAEIMAEVELPPYTAILKLKEFELATPSQG